MRGVGAGTKIEFFTDQGETIRNEYLCPKELKTVFGFFVTLTAFSPQSGPARLTDFAEPADWAKLWTKDRSRYKKSETTLVDKKDQTNPYFSIKRPLFVSLLRASELTQ